MACALTATAPMSELLCAASSSKPHIALCLGGQARTFANALVHRSVVEHVIQALGAHMVVFACVVTSEDEQWQPAPRTLLNSSRGEVRAALRNCAQACLALYIRETLRSVHTDSDQIT